MGACVAAAAAALGIAGEDLVPHLADVTTDALNDVRVWTDADTSLLGVTTSLPCDDKFLPRRMIVLAAGIVPNSPILAGAILARVGDLWIERWSDNVAIVNSAAEATLADEVDTMANVAIGAAGPTALGERLTRLVPADRRRRVLRAQLRKRRVEVYELGVEAPADVLSAILANADALGVPPVQAKLLGTLHGPLAHGGNVMIRARMFGGVVQPGITIAYGPQSLAHTLRVVTSLASRKDAAARLGTLTGALKTERVVAIELELGTTHPVPLRVALAM